LTDDETQALITGTEGTAVHTALLMLLATGVRRGELLALTWADVDVENDTIAVHRSLEKTAAGLRFKSTKTNRGRVVAVPSFALEALRAHRIEQHKERLRYGEVWQDNGLVFSGVLGAPWDPAVFSRAFRRAAIRVGVGSIGPHSLRHTAATEMLREGIHPKVVADRLGHSTTRMTLDVYSHVVPALETDAAAKVDTALRKKFGQHLVSIAPSSRLVEDKKKAANSCGIKDSDGGRERSRTSDLYSVNVALYP
jgi:integrase